MTADLIDLRKHPRDLNRKAHAVIARYQERPQRSPMTFAEIKNRIAGLVPPADPDERADLVATIAMLPSLGDREALIRILSKPTGVRVATLTAEIAEQRQASGNDGASEAVLILDDGHQVLQHTGDAPDQRDARAFLLDVMHDANAEEPRFCLNLGSLMRLLRHRGRAVFEMVTPSAFQGVMGKLCSFAEYRQGEPLKKSLPARDICGALLASLEDGELPQQPTIRRAPTIGPEGQLLDRDGWHGDVFVDLGGLEVPPISAEPSQDDLETARDLIVNDLFRDFPFFDPDAPEQVSPSLANAVAMLLTPFARDLFSGPAPFFGIIKPTAGTGGTLLATIPQLLFDGRETAPTPYTRNEEELQKTVVAAILDGQNFFNFDNVTDLNSDVLKKMATADEVGGRVLGLTKLVSRPNHFVWSFTGNNVRLGAEMRRRTCFIRLNSLTSNNAGRSFTHPHLKEWALDQRGRLIAALLTLVRAWVVAGKNPGKATLASFDGWAATIGGVLEHAAIEGFLENPAPEREDREGAEIAEFAREWWVRWTFHPVTEADAFKWAEGIESPLVSGFAEERRRRFAEALDALSGRTFNLESGERMMARNEAGEWALIEPPKD